MNCFFQKIPNNIAQINTTTIPIIELVPKIKPKTNTPKIKTIILTIFSKLYSIKTPKRKRHS